MGVPYDVFTSAFLSKITEYRLLDIPIEAGTEIVDGYMKRAITKFEKVCLYSLSRRDDYEREFLVEIPENDLDEIVDIVSEGMVEQWLKPYVYRQENLENVLSTKDFSMYSPAELLLRISNVYAKAQRDYTNMIREYSYSHADILSLHI